ncbi:hypothetical protein [Aeromonas jandaei]|uniref:hypothetical protein n=1 Tax=Aeromonas jandaei TaxID=650 RepID=UPI0038D76101
MTNANLLLDQIRGLQSTIESMPDNESAKELCEHFFSKARRELSELQNEHPQAYEQVESLALSFASLVTCVSSYYTTIMLNRKEKAGEDRRIANTVSGLYADVARAKAQKFWDADSDREFRVGEVAKLVHEIMCREGYFRANERGKVAPTVGTVKRWIAHLAPDYGRRPGRNVETV